MTNNQITTIIDAQDDPTKKIEIWNQHYDILQCGGRLYAKNDAGIEIIKLYCHCDNCRKDTENLKYEELFLELYNKSFDALNLQLNASTYEEKIKIWVDRFGINYCIKYVYGEKELSILPTTKIEIKQYNQMQYNLWKKHYFSSEGKERYARTDLKSRVEQLNRQLVLSPFKEEILQRTKADMKDHYEQKVNYRTKKFFQDLIVGKPMSLFDEIWELGDLIDYIDANEAYQFLCYLNNVNMIIKEPFLSYSAEIIAETNHGMTWTQISKYFTEKAVLYNRDIPYADKNFLDLVDKHGKKVSNKRTAFFENLKAFTPNEQFEIINDLCDNNTNIPGIMDLKQLLITQYKDLRLTSPIDGSEEIIEEVKGLLSNYKKAEASYNSSIEKLKNGIYQRNAVDDLRLTLELLVKEILSNEKSLENQQAELKKFLASKNVLPEIANLIWGNIDNITKYHNRYVKHDDNVGKVDSEMILDMTTTLLKLIIKAVA